MRKKERIKTLEIRVKSLEKSVACLKGKHHLLFYHFGESSIPGDFFLQEHCPDCHKIFQRTPSRGEIYTFFQALNTILKISG